MFIGFEYKLIRSGVFKNTITEFLYSQSKFALLKWNFVLKFKLDENKSKCSLKRKKWIF